MNDDEIRANQEFMRKQEEELIRHRLSFLPAIKQDIQRYLKVSQTRRQSSNLQKSFSLLEEVLDSSEDLEDKIAKNVSEIFGKFEAAKSIARVEILAIRTNHEVGLSDWRVGKQEIRNANHVKTSEFEVIDLWAANIIPDTHWLTFQLPARITVVHCPSYYRIAFGLGTSIDDFSTSIIQIELPQIWIDPLIKHLRHLDLFPVQGNSPISLNGIFYELYTSSWVSQSLIEFSNPEIRENESFAAIESTLFSIAEMVINEKGQQPEKDFLSIWQKCLVKSKNA
jgi:hypothetical protein